MLLLRFPDAVAMQYKATAGAQIASGNEATGHQQDSAELPDAAGTSVLESGALKRIVAKRSQEKERAIRWMPRPAQIER